MGHLLISKIYGYCIYALAVFTKKIKPNPNTFVFYLGFGWRKEWNTAVSQREPSAGFSLSLKCERRQQVAALRSRLFPPKQKGMPEASPFVLAERVGFEPTIRCRIPDFESGPL